MKFCCLGFEHWHSAAGTRGFGVFAADGEYGPAMFLIQHRALDVNGGDTTAARKLLIAAERQPKVDKMVHFPLYIFIH